MTRPSPMDDWKEIGALKAKVAQLEQYKTWAEPQIVQHGADRERIAKLEAALIGCIEHMEWSTPQGLAAHAQAAALVSSSAETPPKYGTCPLCGGMGGAHLTTCKHWPAFAAETACEPQAGVGQLCHLCGNVHDLMSACPPKKIPEKHQDWATETLAKMRSAKEETLTDDRWLCDCMLTVKKGYACICGRTEKIGDDHGKA